MRANSGCDAWSHDGDAAASRFAQEITAPSDRNSSIRGTTACTEKHSTARRRAPLARSRCLDGDSTKSQTASTRAAGSSGRNQNAADPVLDNFRQSSHSRGHYRRRRKPSLPARRRENFPIAMPTRKMPRSGRDRTSRLSASARNAADISPRPAHSRSAAPSRAVHSHPRYRLRQSENASPDSAVINSASAASRMASFCLSRRPV